MVKKKRWISTGQAAEIVGYSPDHFREKFKSLIPHRVFQHGHYRWDREAVVKLAQDNVSGG